MPLVSAASATVLSAVAPPPIEAEKSVISYSVPVERAGAELTRAVSSGIAAGSTDTRLSEEDKISSLERCCRAEEEEPRVME